jgi:regulator of protease activity HflC (stomatin/prohibitin superfamily)
VADLAPPLPPGSETIQLAQVRVPLHEAGAVFETPDVSGRIPIVVIPSRPVRVRIDLLGAAAGLIVIGFILAVIGSNFLFILACLVGAAVLALMGGLSAFLVRVPEGTSALMVQGGRHRGVLSSGSHIVMPWVVVSHIVTRRQIPFELPLLEALTQDSVRARISALLTFVIADPGRFVYAIAAPDFDLVMRAAGEDGVRSILRTMTWSDVLDMGPDQASTLRERIAAHVISYGVEVEHLNITYARPEAAFLQAEESRELAIVQRAEAAEAFALAERRMQDEQAIARVRVMAAIDQDRERLRAEAEQAEMRQRIAEVDAATQALRLARLEESLARFPKAAEWEWQGEQLAVARALAGNTRAIVQVGQLGDIARSVVPRDMAAESAADSASPNGPTT